MPAPEKKKLAPRKKQGRKSGAGSSLCQRGEISIPRIEGEGMFKHSLLSSLALGALVATSAPAQAEARQIQQFDIPAQDRGAALRAFARASGVQVIFDGKAVRGKRSEALRHRSGAEEALRELLRGTGLTYRRDGKI